MSARRAAPSSGTEDTRSASSGLNGWNAGGFSGTSSRTAFRTLFFAVQSALAGISAGPSWPWTSRRPANRTGTGSIVNPYRSQSFGSCVHAR